MKIPELPKLNKEDFPDADENFDKLSVWLNGTTEPLISALQGKLSFTDNINAQVKEITVTVPPLQWTNVSTFVNGWNQYGNPNFGPAGYRIDAYGMVHLRGLIASGTVPAAAFILPSGYRPASPPYLLFTSQSSAGMSRVDIGSSGHVIIQAGSNVWSSLDNIRFLAQPPAPPLPWTGNDWPLTIKTSINGKPQGVLVLSAIDTTDQGNIMVPGCSPDWLPIGNDIKLRALHGLVPGRKYTVKLLIIGP